MTVRSICLVAGVVVATAALQAQTPSPSLPTAIPSVRFNAGQNVVPYFEGWIKNTDGSFDLIFGYFNRNYQEELLIPPGPDNKIEPGAADQGQPTYFLPRRNRWTFRVRVPSDFGKKALTWTLTAQGKTEKAYGELLPVQEITERIVMTNGGLGPGEDDPNTPPTITVAPPAAATTTAPLALVASVVDDGLPKPRTPAAPAPRPAPPPTPGQPNFGAQVNSSGGGGRPRGLNVSWMQLRGPAKATFEPASGIPVVNGEASTRVRFPAPGSYKLVATANDGALSRKTEVTITVRGNP